ncbi:protein crumbs homolog 2a [Myxocyprinus asiaticus]|uniref:protein crumbs homolog 2a n=1 Tax=Myxocyprinus asiaticus TaxID=70543 RepID=UPI0022214CD6|nr:protein crumbs homolog 2a [Myxocyprinus asiaticus]
MPQITSFKTNLILNLLTKMSIFCSGSSELCASSPCQNGATCVDTMDGYVCLCSREGVRYMGKDCEELYDACVFVKCEGCVSELGTEHHTCPGDVNECESGPCVGALSECVDELNGYRCLCPPGFGGEDCSHQITDCIDDPCLNNGTCKRVVDGFECTCSSGFSGEICEEDLDECASHPCQNGAICLDGANMYHCFCVPGYQGHNCEIDINECASRPCWNNGTCINEKDRYICECFLGYTGVNCELEIDECESNPCQNGASCHDLVRLYTCDCVQGFEGPDCEINIDDCESDPCQNGGVCHDLIDSYECQCEGTGFMGDHCEEDIPECASDPCQHGATCLEGINHYSCTCWPGFEGNNCELDIDECADAPCENDGKCFEKSNPDHWVTDWKFTYATVAGYICQCQPGYTGENCSVDINECESKPCHNGGSCEDMVNGYMCLCAEGFAGLECEVNIDECESAPCLNGGVCEDGIAKYKCHCAEAKEGLLPWGGPQCSVQLLGCIEHVCQNGATCQPRFDREAHGHTCLCPPGFYDDVCSTPTTFSFSSPSFFLFEVPPLRRRRDTEHWRTLKVSLRFRTTLPDMLLFFRGSTELFVCLEIVGGELHTRAVSGTGESLEEQLPGLVSDGDWHEATVSIDEQAKKLVLQVKGPGCDNQACRAEDKLPDDHGPFLHHEGLTKVYVGGVPEEYLEFTLTGHGFLGCMEDLQVDGHPVLPHDLGDEEVSIEVGCMKTEWCQVDQHPCSQHGHCIDLWTSYQCDCYRPHHGHDCSQEYPSYTFSHRDSTSFLAFELLSDIGKNFTVSFFLRSLKMSGMLLQLRRAGLQGTEGEDPYFTIFLKMGRVHVTSVAEAPVLSSPVFVCNGEKLLLHVDVQEGQVFFNHGGLRYGLGSLPELEVLGGDLVYVGGVPGEEDVTEWGGHFKGCLQDLRLDDVYLDGETWNETLRETVYISSDAENVRPGCVSDDTCKVQPCLNGGECTVTWNDFTCSCTRDFTGKTCETRVWCVSDPCVNGGRCVDLFDGFECIANATFDNTPLHYSAKGSLVAPVENVTMELRTRQVNGVLLRAWRGAELFLIGLLDSSILVELHNENMEPVIFSGQRHIADGNWHHLLVAMAQPDRDTSPWVILVDGIIDGSSAPLLAGSLHFLKDRSSEVALAEIYTGCLGTVRVGGVNIPFVDNVKPPQTSRFWRRQDERVHIGCFGAPVCHSHPCRHGGTCVDLFNMFGCQCPSGWEGATCEKETDECASEPCVHGKCKDKLNGFDCMCHLGYTGPTCSENVDDCKRSQCKNGGTCMDGVNDYTCYCPPKYSGTRCQFNYPPLKCELDVECENDGVCRDTQWGANCTCSPGFTGERCESEIDECASSPCLNGGSCLDRLNRFQCLCPAGFSGQFCETNKQAQKDRIPWLVIVVPLVCGCVLLAAIGLMFMLMTARRKRQSEGMYSPSQQEVAGARLEMDSMLKVPPEERLI